ncbi:RhoGEF domain [Nesidiocoris tenuis]|uniref:RhoGEF domain n=1 Tax=Nesidiocoris tenuis TaxID=355587 RepID=A0ABN7A7S4_9HEMI|nr:RhoGEF domain [Nesidiocoris tenuis]
MSETRFAMEGKLLFAQSADGTVLDISKARLRPVDAVLVILGTPTEGYKPEGDAPTLNNNTGIREAALVLVKDHMGKYSLIRDPLYLDKCVVSRVQQAQEEGIEVRSVMSEENYYFQGESREDTIRWLRQLQYHAQGLGAWRQRRNAVPNIVVPGVRLRP